MHVKLTTNHNIYFHLVHNCAEIEGSLYAITHITGFRLDHKCNRTTMDDNTVTSLATIAVLIQGQGIAMA